MSNPDYTLYYWAVPFRGHFIRAILSYAGADWQEGEGVPELMGMPADKQPRPFMGPPLLIDHKNGNFALSQMPAIAVYLGEQFKLIPDNPQARALTAKIVSDANDLIDELTQQGGREMWTTVKWTDYQARLKKWMSFWEAELEGEYLLGTPQPTVADIVSATLWRTMCERFPAIEKTLKAVAPKTAAHAEKLWKNELSDFAKESWEKYGKSYAGGQIGASMEEIIK